MCSRASSDARILSFGLWEYSADCWAAPVVGLSAFTTEAPLYNAFHLHTLGSGWQFEYVCDSYASDGSTDQPYFVTQDGNGVNYVESLYPQFTDNDSLLTAWPLTRGDWY